MACQRRGRSNWVCPARTGIVAAAFGERVDRMVGVLQLLGVSECDRIAVLSPNTHVMLALHYAVP